MPVFRDILGQDRALDVLRRAAQGQRVAQGYLFCGPMGVGKAMVARALASALNCAQEPGEGCGRCPSCEKLDRGLHPDFIALEPDGTFIKIDQVRALEDRLSFRPHEGRYRLVLIDGADRLNDHAANALLKTVEEPRPGTHFVLATAASHQVAPTLVSRCQRLRFVPLGPPSLMTIVERAQVGSSPEERQAAVAFCEGSARRALDLLSGERITGLQTVATNLRRAGESGDVSAIFEAAAEAGKDRGLIQEALDLLRLELRDGLLDLARSEAGTPVPDDPGRRHVLKRLKAVDLAQAAIRGNVNPALVLEHLALQWRHRA